MIRSGNPREERRDEVKLRSGCMQNAIAGALEKLIRERTGYHPQQHFTDGSRITCDGDRAKIRLNVDAEREKKIGKPSSES